MNMSNSFIFHRQAYIDWQAHPTLNSLETTGLPISDIDFPAITICGQGSIYEVTQQVKIIIAVYERNQTNPFALQVTENVINWQFKRYVTSLGKIPDILTMVEKEDLMSEMIDDLYPGKDEYEIKILHGRTYEYN